MTGRLNPVFAMAAAALLAASLSPSGTVEAQDRYRVLIPDSYAEDGADRRFGQRMADELRKLIGTMPTHVAVEKRQIDDELRKLGVKMEELDCVKTRQLGGVMGTPRMAICLSYVSEGDGRRVTAIEVWDIWDDESFTIGTFTAGKDDHREAAQKVYEGFEAFDQQLRQTIFCAEAAGSQNWAEALDRCDRALALNPTAINTIYLRADILRHLERYEDALAGVDRVLAADPYREDALQLGGWLATQLGQNAKGREYYGLYLELNPGDVDVRRRIAYEMAEVGDPEGAMQFIETGLGVEEDADLLLDFGSYAFAAGTRVSQATQADNSGGIAPEGAAFYRKAAEALTKAFNLKGAEMDVRYLRNIVSAYVQLQEYDQAIRSAESFMAAHPQEIGLLAIYSQALERTGNIDEAVAVLGRIGAVDPDYPDLHFRQGMMMLSLGRVDDAIPFLMEASQRGRDPDVVSDQIFGEANRRGIQTENWTEAVRLIETAKSFPISQQQKQKLDFYHGFALLKRGESMQPGSGATPASARQTLPLFQQSQSLLEGSRAWAQSSNNGNTLTQLLTAAGTYIEIQQLTIQRGGGQ